MPADLPAPRSGLVALALALLGLAVSVYLTVEHYTGSTTLACADTGAINCVKVTTSRWSHLGPIPVAVLGLVFFVAMTALCVPPAWRSRVLDRPRVIGAAVGVLTALYLVWVELFRLDAICLWCTAAHVCSLLLLGAVLWTNSEINAK